MSFRKDRSLDELARVGNVAQFVSFAPGGDHAKQQFSRVAGYEPNHVFATNHEAIASLLSVQSRWHNKFTQLYAREPTQSRFSLWDR